jgi:hypothetical protein
MSVSKLVTLSLIMSSPISCGPSKATTATRNSGGGENLLIRDWAGPLAENQKSNGSPALAIEWRPRRVSRKTEEGGFRNCGVSTKPAIVFARAGRLAREIANGAPLLAGPFRKRVGVEVLHDCSVLFVLVLILV